MRWRALPPDVDTPDVGLARELRGLIAQVVRPDVTNDEWAASIGISPSALSTAVNGRNVPSASVLDKMLTGLTRAGLALAADERVEWEGRRTAAAAFARAASLPAAQTADDAVLAQISTGRANWDSAPSEDPDYRLFSDTTLLDGVALNAAYRPARTGRLSPDDGAFVLASAVYRGTTYKRWLTLIGTTPQAAEALVDGVLTPFRRVRWRSAWLLQTFPDGLRDRAATLIDELWSTTGGDREPSPSLPEAIRNQTVRATLQIDPDPNLERNNVRIALLNEFAVETTTRGARGRLVTDEAPNSD